MIRKILITKHLTLITKKIASQFFSFPPLTEMFYFSGYASDDLRRQIIAVFAIGFPHSVIPGSKLARQLPEAYRSHATTFIASTSQGIHHTPLVLFRSVSKIQADKLGYLILSKK